MIWAADDSTASKGAVTALPRDNVVFECGLFMGALGKDRVFVAIDKSTDIKVPSDFAGITLVFYDGSRVSDKDGAAAVREACDLIARAMREPRYQELVGEWCSRYAKAADLDHGEVIDDLDITAIPGGIHFRAPRTMTSFLSVRWPARRTVILAHNLS
jgi:Predicted nucleotide-binding protein containing TIR-like domain